MGWGGGVLVMYLGFRQNRGVVELVGHSQVFGIQGQQHICICPCYLRAKPTVQRQCILTDVAVELVGVVFECNACCNMIQQHRLLPELEGMQHLRVHT